MNAPCKDCTDRYLGCHNVCDKYKEFAAENQKRKLAEQKERQDRNFSWEIRQSRYKKR